MSDKAIDTIGAIQWLVQTGTAHELCREIIAPAVARALKDEQLSAAQKEIGELKEDNGRAYASLALAAEEEAGWQQVEMELRDEIEGLKEWARQVSERKDVPKGIRHAARHIYTGKHGEDGGPRKTRYWSIVD